MRLGKVGGSSGLPLWMTEGTRKTGQKLEGSNIFEIFFGKTFKVSDHLLPFRPSQKLSLSQLAFSFNTVNYLGE